MNDMKTTQSENSESWGVFKINDCDWWLARSADEARTAAARFYCCRPEDEDIEKEVVKLTAAQLASHEFYEEADRSKEPITFAEELKKRIAAGPTVEIFATTEF